MVTINIYHIVQEAIQNAVRHGRADKISTVMETPESVQAEHNRQRHRHDPFRRSHRYGFENNELQGKTDRSLPF